MGSKLNALANDTAIVKAIFDYYRNYSIALLFVAAGSWFFSKHVEGKLEFRIDFDAPLEVKLIGYTVLCTILVLFGCSLIILNAMQWNAQTRLSLEHKWAFSLMQHTEGLSFAIFASFLVERALH